MNPSTTTGSRSCAAPRKTPVIAHRSNPPTLCRTSTGSSASGRLTASACSMTRFFFKNASSVRPPPRPDTASTDSPLSAANTADEVVVLPMPISPTPRSCWPPRFASAASSMPVRMPCTACSRVIAGPAAMFAVPLPRERFMISGHVYGSAMPMSTTTSPSPKCFARHDAPVRPRVRLMDCARVTDCGADDTPSQTTPLSAAST